MQEFNPILLLSIPLAWFMLYNYDKTMINVINGKKHREGLKQLNLKDVSNKALRLIYDFAICLLFFMIILLLLFYKIIILVAISTIIILMLLIAKHMLFMKSIESTE